MSEQTLNLACRRLTRKTEDAYLAGDVETAVRWSQKLDKVIYQLMLIKNRELMEGVHAAK